MRALLTTLAALLAAASLAACGSSSGDATSLLKQTFGGTHRINSGNLSVNVTVSPSGASTLRSPISLGFGGPFQNRGAGQLPASNFEISVNAGGTSLSLGILSTGSAGYVTLGGNAYQLPQATYQQLERSFAQASPSGPGQSAFSKLGIDPLRWLRKPAIVGSERVGGVQTTHIRAGIDISAFLQDINALLSRAASLGGASRLPTQIPDATRLRLAGAIKSPGVDVWTGASDKTLRKLTIGMSVPDTGQISPALAALRSLQLAISMQYTSLNQPQTISAPAMARPFSEFTSKLRGLLGSLQSGVAGSAASGGSSPSTGASSSAGGTGGASAVNAQAYAQCIQQAKGDITKMQRCAPLLNGK